jgi:hypothetical protein
MEAEMNVLLKSGLMKVLAASALLTGLFLVTMVSLSRDIEPKSDGTIVVAQRFCPNGRC